MLGKQVLDNVLDALGRTLADRGLEFRIVVVGGSALLLAGEGVRPTRDLDVVALEVDGLLRQPARLPDSLQQAARDIAPDFDLSEDWLNTGAVGVIEARHLPSGFHERLSWRSYHHLDVGVPARQDLVALKLKAAADEGVASAHSLDLVRMRATMEELESAANAVEARSGTPRSLELADLMQQLRALGLR